MSEGARISQLAGLLAFDAPGIELGIGDDAAVLTSGPNGDRKLVWTIDEQVEEVHFRRDFLSWSDVGWRSYVAAASDVAAMGAVPWCALSAIVLPSDVSDQDLGEIGCGQRDAAMALGAPIIGGNLSRGRSLTIATAVLGTCVRAVRRVGACDGDGLWLAGSVGIARAGLEALLRGLGEQTRLAPALAAWRRPRPYIAEAVAMGPSAHAAIDVSDGLACDVGHMASASGVRIVIEEAALLADPVLCDVADALGQRASDLALYGGEDYAIVIASDVDVAGFRRIGSVRVGSGVALASCDGLRELEPKGFDHFG